MPREEFDALREEFDALVESSKTIESELEDEIREGERRIGRLEDDKALAEKRSAESSSRLHGTGRELEVVHSKLVELQESARFLEQKHRTLEEENDAFERRKREADAELDGLRDQLERALEANVFVNNDLEDLQSEISELRAAQATSTSGHLDVGTDSESAATFKVAALEEELGHTRAELDESREAQAQMESELSEVSEDVMAKSEDIWRLQQQLKLAQTDIADAATARDLAASNEEKMAALESAREAAEEALVSARGAAEEAQAAALMKARRGCRGRTGRGAREGPCGTHD